MRHLSRHEYETISHWNHWTSIPCDETCGNNQPMIEDQVSDGGNTTDQLIAMKYLIPVDCPFTGSQHCELTSTGREAMRIYEYITTTIDV